MWCIVYCLVIALDYHGYTQRRIQSLDEQRRRHPTWGRLLYPRQGLWSLGLMGMYGVCMGTMALSVSILEILKWPRPFADVWIDLLLFLIVLSFAIAWGAGVVTHVQRHRHESR